MVGHNQLGDTHSWHLGLEESQTRALALALAPAGRPQRAMDSLSPPGWPEGEKLFPARLLGMGVLVVVMGLGPRPAQRQKLSPTLKAATVAFFLSVLCGPWRGQNLSEPSFPHPYC